MRTFVVLAEELHFRRAADRLHIAQPAVSAQLQALEREIGVPLFTRSTRRVQLTEAGEVFHRRCAEILRDIDRSCSETQAAAGKGVGHFVIGTIYPATLGILPRFLTRISALFPDIRIHINNGNSTAIVRDIERGATNIGFIRPLEHIGALRWQTIVKEPYLLAVPTRNPLADAEVIRLKDLQGQKIISFERRTPSHTEAYFNDLFRSHDLHRNIAFTCDDTLAMIALVSAGMGVGFVPEWVSLLPNPAYRLKPVVGVNHNVSLGFAWSADDPTVNREEIIEIARQLAV
ncbi:MAG: LysR family transcriptional regulator [Paracoccus aminovorans]|nr:LysR family transcriptional regulator [Paracoccus aminovorans]